MLFVRHGQDLPWAIVEFGKQYTRSYIVYVNTLASAGLLAVEFIARQHSKFHEPPPFLEGDP